MSVISIYESKVACLSSILGIQKKCANAHIKLSTEANRFLLYSTVKKVGAATAQKVVSKLVDKGELTWDNEDEFDVEQIQDRIIEDGVEYFLIKWRGWSSAHNTWEPRDNLDCYNLLEEFAVKNGLKDRSGVKRKIADIKGDDEEQILKKQRLEEVFTKLISCKEGMTPERFISLTSPGKKQTKTIKGIISCEGQKTPKFVKYASLKNPQSKAYKAKKIEKQIALKNWETHLNEVNTDPAAILVENNVDLEGPPENFIYINDYKPGPGIVIPNDPPIGCECTDCFKEKSQCCAAQFGVEFAYYKNHQVRVHPGRPIYECNKRCKCGPDCPNRVVQKGRRHKVCVFRTQNGRGWGVKAMQTIKAGTFVMEYVGEVISNEEAEIRGQTYDAVGRTYLFDLDFNSQGGDCPYTVDAAIYGNVSHFVNHSCDPNLEVYSVWINTLDTHLPRIALFSRRRIEKGEELTFDYMSSNVHSPLEESSDSLPTMNEAGVGEMTEQLDENDNSTGVVTNSGSPKKSLDITGPGGDAEGASITPSRSSSPQKAATTSVQTSSKNTEGYHMVCQCGAKKCRKFVF